MHRQLTLQEGKGERNLDCFMNQNTESQRGDQNKRSKREKIYRERRDGGGGGRMEERVGGRREIKLYPFNSEHALTFHT